MHVLALVLTVLAATPDNPPDFEFGTLKGRITPQIQSMPCPTGVPIQGFTNVCEKPVQGGSYKLWGKYGADRIFIFNQYNRLYAIQYYLVDNIKAEQAEACRKLFYDLEKELTQKWGKPESQDRSGDFYSVWGKQGQDKTIISMSLSGNSGDGKAISVAYMVGK